MEKGAKGTRVYRGGVEGFTEEVPATIPDSFIVACAIKCTKIYRSGVGRGGEDDATVH